MATSAPPARATTVTGVRGDARDAIGARTRREHPTIDAASGDAVDAYDVSTFVQLDPVTTMYTLYEQKANVSSPARVGAASEQALRDALLNFDRDAGAWFLAQHVLDVSRLLLLAPLRAARRASSSTFAARAARATTPPCVRAWTTT